MAAPLRTVLPALRIKLFQMVATQSQKMIAVPGSNCCCPHASNRMKSAFQSLPTIQYRLYCSTATIVDGDEHEEEDELFKEIHIEVKGHDPEVIKSYQCFVQMAAQELNVNIGSVYTPPKIIKKYSLLKSVHIYKKHMHQYEMRTHFCVLKVNNITGSTASTFLEYIQRNLPEGMAMKVSKLQLMRLPEHLILPKTEAISEKLDAGS